MSELENEQKIEKEKIKAENKAERKAKRKELKEKADQVNGGKPLPGISPFIRGMSSEMIDNQIKAQEKKKMHESPYCKELKKEKEMRSTK